MNAKLSAGFLPHGLGEVVENILPRHCHPSPQFGPVNPLRDECGGGNEYNSNHD